ncbi:MAG TPA: AlpA family phage regulatory protein [Burkholderiaceae bacterium]
MLIRLPQVCERTGMGRTAIYKLIKSLAFPKPVKVGSASLWIDSEVSAWIAVLVSVRDARMS